MTQLKTWETWISVRWKCDFLGKISFDVTQNMKNFFRFDYGTVIKKNSKERKMAITKRHNLRDNLEDLVTFPLVQPLESPRASRIHDSKKFNFDLSENFWVLDVQLGHGTASRPWFINCDSDNFFAWVLNNADKFFPSDAYRVLQILSSLESVFHQMN